MVDYPVISARFLAENLGVSTVSAQKLVKQLVAVEIVRPATGKYRKSALFQADDILELLEHGGEVTRQQQGLLSGRPRGTTIMTSQSSACIQDGCARLGPNPLEALMRVLVVDDEKRLARSLRVGLEAEGFAVDVAHDGTDGLWLARENEYDAILLDLMLPGINGYKVCQTLRGEKDWTPILMLTAKDGEWDQVEGLDTGADDYLTKPFSFPVLVARLRAVARRGARERPTLLEAGDIRVDPAAHRVWRGDIEIELTAREFAMLAFLTRHQGDVLSKRQILEAVWDVDFEGDPNIVEVYIRHLRNKLDRPFGRKAIETLRGAGYRMASNGG